jgi:hypothetical protein
LRSGSDQKGTQANGTRSSSAGCRGGASFFFDKRPFCDKLLQLRASPKRCLLRSGPFVPNTSPCSASGTRRCAEERTTKHARGGDCFSVCRKRAARGGFVPDRWGKGLRSAVILWYTYLTLGFTQMTCSCSPAGAFFQGPRPAAKRARSAGGSAGRAGV